MSASFRAPAALLNDLPKLTALQQGLAAQDLSVATSFDVGRTDQPLDVVLYDIAQDRAGIYLDLIDVHSELSEIGIRRVMVLGDVFNFYAHDVLGGDTSAAMRDVMQQESDVAIMFSLSHSFLMQARKYAEYLPADRLKTCEDSISTQEKRLPKFKKEAADIFNHMMEHLSSGPSASAESVVAAHDKFENVTLEAANQNVVVCVQTGRLIESISHGLYVQMKALKENETPDLKMSLMLHEDFEYDNALNALALERYEALAKRADGLYRLAEKVADSLQLSPA